MSNNRERGTRGVRLNKTQAQAALEELAKGKAELAKVKAELEEALASKPVNIAGDVSVNLYFNKKSE